MRYINLHLTLTLTYSKVTHCHKHCTGWDWHYCWLF